MSEARAPSSPLAGSESGRAVQAVPDLPCFHCGLPVSPGTRFGVETGGVWRAVCCPGCEAVASSILGQGLGDYYRLRDSSVPGRPPAPDGADLSAFDNAEAQRSFVKRTDQGLEALLLLEGIRCSACVWLIERTLARLPGIAAVDVNYATQRARVVWNAQSLRFSRILQAVRSIGYCAYPYEPNRLELMQREERRAALWRLFVAGFGMMQVMMYAVPAYMAGPGDMSEGIGQLFRWASLVLTLPVILYSASPFFRGALRGLRSGRLGMDAPVALGIAIAFAASSVATLTGGGPVYFDSISMFVFLLLLGRFLESIARNRASASLQHLGRLVPEIAQRLIDYPATLRTEAVPVAALSSGDFVLVRPGDTAPADCTVEQGETHASEALLTGESRPVAKKVGSPLVGGSVNVGNAIVARVERVGAETVLSAILRLVERAAGEKQPMVELAERVAGWFVFAVLLLALLAGIYWTVVEPDKALWVAISVLVATCPCAFSLATPVAVAVSTAEFARLGLIVTRSHVAEGLARITDVVIDKTGTLTRGELQLIELSAFGRVSREECLRIAAALESASEHPVGRAILAAAAKAGGAIPAATAIHTEPGAGVEAAVAGRRYRIGKPDFVMPLAQSGAARERDEGAVLLGGDGGLLAALRFGDELRPEAPGAVGELRDLGLRVHLLSGDAITPTRQAARQAGIERFAAGARPGHKQDYVRQLQRRGAIVAMVGDGINDAPVLAQADVSVAMGSGVKLAQIQADAVLLAGGLEGLGRSIRLARKTRAVVRENVLWAFGYNATVLPLALSGVVAPWMAAIGMSASSLVVVANALRLLGKRTGEDTRSCTDTTMFARDASLNPDT